jgi:hypothetical protein
VMVPQQLEWRPVFVSLTSAIALIREPMHSMYQRVMLRLQEAHTLAGAEESSLIFSFLSSQ